MCGSNARVCVRVSAQLMTKAPVVPLGLWRRGTWAVVCRSWSLNHWTKYSDLVEDWCTLSKSSVAFFRPPQRLCATRMGKGPLLMWAKLRLRRVPRLLEWWGGGRYSHEAVIRRGMKAFYSFPCPFLPKGEKIGAQIQDDHFHYKEHCLRPEIPMGHCESFYILRN